MHLDTAVCQHITVHPLLLRALDYWTPFAQRGTSEEGEGLGMRADPTAPRLTARPHYYDAPSVDGGVVDVTGRSGVVGIPPCSQLIACGIPSSIMES